MTALGLSVDLLLRRSETFRLDLDLTIRPGKTVALLGPNGSGKSTAVAAIAGLLPIDTGEISLNGTVLDNPDRALFMAAESAQDRCRLSGVPAVSPSDGAGERRLWAAQPPDRTGRGATRSRAWLARLGLGSLKTASQVISPVARRSVWRWHGRS